MINISKLINDLEEMKELVWNDDDWREIGYNDGIDSAIYLLEAASNLDHDKSDNNDFKVGEYIIYINGDTCQIGRIKRIVDDGAFVYYHEGDTASKTPFDHMHKLANSYVVKSTSLGGVEQ